LNTEVFTKVHKEINMKSISFLVGLIFCSVTSLAQTTASLIPKKGLFVTTNDLTWISGSEINFLTPQRNNHHYYFTWWEQDVDSTQFGKEVLLLGSENTAVNGTYSIEKVNSTIKTSIDCKWNLKGSAVADIVYAKIWLPFLKEATWSSNNQKDIKNLSEFYDTLLVATTSFGIFQFRSSCPFKIKINANPNPGAKDYTQRSQYLILLDENIPVNQPGGLHRSFFVEEVQTASTVKKTSITKNIVLEKVNDAWKYSVKQNPLLPQPKSIELIKKQYIIPRVKPGVVSDAANHYRNILQLLWQIGNNYYPNIITQQNNQLADEGYTIGIKEKVINIQYKTKQGLQYALHTLVQLTKNENGKLIIQQGNIKDEPSVSWRGIHMFTGPTSWQLHKRMYDRILFPLKMNKVVLQCEQAEWKSFPEIHNPISVPLKDLKAEFAYLRMNNAEPIPLIQSLGHMEWFFKPKKNRFMAVNPQYPYTLNPDLLQSKRVVKQLWDEAFALLKPTTIHIGFDEIGMIGFNIPREKEMDFFKTQMNFLHYYAQQKKAKLMIWGDMGLAPGEGPDALNGVTKQRAATIRSFIPAGTYIGDWHYLNNPDPSVYKINLQIWKQNNDLPIASPWLWPNNVRGFVHAAIDENAGVLQTTWADFESSEKNMLQNIEQFGAYILAMDYAWSGRKELPKGLPYDAVEEWTNRFCSQPKPISNKNGWRILEPIQFQNITSAAQINLPAVYNFKWKNISSSGFVFKATTETILPEGTPVAVIQFLGNDKVLYEKQIRYGVEVRSKTDQRNIYAHTPGKDEKTLFDFFQKQLTITGVRIRNLHAASGLTIDEFMLIE
jgi:hypothetical protein